MFVGALLTIFLFQTKTFTYAYSQPGDLPDCESPFSKSKYYCTETSTLTSCPPTEKSCSKDGKEHCCKEKIIKDNDETCDKSKLASFLTEVDAVTSKNKVIFGDKLSVQNVISSLQCYDYCVRDDKCQGFNFQYKTENTSKICELIGNVHWDTNAGIITKTKENYMYYMINHDKFRDTFLNDNGCDSEKDIPIRPTLEGSGESGSGEVDRSSVNGNKMG